MDAAMEAERIRAVEIANVSVLAHCLLIARRNAKSNAKKIF